MKFTLFITALIIALSFPICADHYSKYKKAKDAELEKVLSGDTPAARAFNAEVEKIERERIRSERRRQEQIIMDAKIAEIEHRIKINEMKLKDSEDMTKFLLE